MFEKANLERLKKISQKIEAIFKNCENGISEALKDEVTLQGSIMMKFVNIDELIKGIQKSNDLEALAVFSKDEIGAFNKTRNIASHEYEEINYDFMEIAIKDNLPPLKEKIDNSIKEYYANLDNQNKTEQSNDNEFNPLTNDDIDKIAENKNDSSALDEFRAKHSENSETDTDTDSDKGDKNKPKRNKQ